MIINKKYEINDTGRDFIVGDIHGCLDQLNSELIRVGFDKSKDRLFSVGDLIDRGANSMDCLNLIHEDWFHPVIGNHEMMMMDYVASPTRNEAMLWFGNGGEWAKTADSETLVSNAIHVNQHIPLTISLETKSGKIGISHAQPPSSNWAMCEKGDLDGHEVMMSIWARSLIQQGSDYDWTCKNVDFTIHGHTVIPQDYYRVGNAIFIDTGSFLKGDEYPEFKGVQVWEINELIKEATS